LLHVVDAANPQASGQIHEVQRVLQDIGADSVAQLMVFNKIDALEVSRQPRQLVDEVEREGGVRSPRVFVSAVSGQGLDELRRLIAQAAAPGARPTPAAAPDPRFESLRSTDRSTLLS
jgi:GTP-binding protein HflX